MTEKRKDPRRHLVYYLSVVDEDTGQPLGRLGDLSHEGLLLLTSTPPERWRTYRLRVLPPADLQEGAPFVISAQCMWTRPDVNPDLGLAGFRFALADANTKKVIRGLMDEFGFSDGHAPGDDNEDDE